MWPWGIFDLVLDPFPRNVPSICFEYEAPYSLFQTFSYTIQTTDVIYVLYAREIMVKMLKINPYFGKNPKLKIK